MQSYSATEQSLISQTAALIDDRCRHRTATSFGCYCSLSSHTRLFLALHSLEEVPWNRPMFSFDSRGKPHCFWVHGVSRHCIPSLQVPPCSEQSWGRVRSPTWAWLSAGCLKAFAKSLDSICSYTLVPHISHSCMARSSSLDKRILLSPSSQDLGGKYLRRLQGGVYRPKQQRLLHLLLRRWVFDDDALF